MEGATPPGVREARTAERKIWSVSQCVMSGKRVSGGSRGSVGLGTKIGMMGPATRSIVR